MNSRTPRRGLPLVRSAFAALTVGTLAAALALIVPTWGDDADARDLSSAITGMTYSGNQSTPLQPGETFALDATWLVPDDAEPGDTFTIGFPSSVQGEPMTFRINSSTGIEIATCVVGASSLVCTLSDYVADHTKIQGTMHFSVKLLTPYDELLFTLSQDTVWRVPVPPNPNPGPSPTPTPTPTTTPRPTPPPVDRILKSAVRHRGMPGWAITLPAESLMFSGQEVPLTDTMDEYQIPQLDTLQVWRYAQQTTTAIAELHAGSGPDTFTLTSDGDHRFRIAIHQPMAGMYYRIQYAVQIADGTPDGTVLSNTVEGWGRATASQTYQEADGKGDGYPAGTITVTKVVSGTAPAAAVEYPLTVDCTYAADASLNYHRTGSVTAGSNVTFRRIPLGSTCTVRETDSRGAIASYSPEGEVRVTTSSPRVNVKITNTFPLSGSLTIVKRINGDGPAPAGPFPMTVTCTLDQTETTHDVEVTVAAPAVVDGIPLGSRCTVTETNDRGADFVSYDRARVDIVSESVTEQIVVTNTYLIARGSLVIVKQTDGNAPAPAGDFPMEVECTLRGTAVAEFPHATSVRLGTPARLDRIPVGSVCSVRETDSRGASAVSYSADSVTIRDSATPSTITVVNTYTSGAGLAFTGRELRSSVALLALAQTAFVVGAILVIVGRRRRRPNARPSQT